MAGSAERRAVPARIREAVALLPLRPDSSVLEVGSGSGAAAQLVCDTLRGGNLLAIDRSATAVRRIADRNDAHIIAGRLTVAAVQLADLDADPAAFDLAFAVNVNLFWTRDASPELAVLERVIRPGGSLHLLYDTGPAGSASKAVEPARRALTDWRFEGVTTVAGQSVVAIGARRP